MSSGVSDTELLGTVAPMAAALNLGDALRGVGDDIALGRLKPVHKNISKT